MILKVYSIRDTKAEAFNRPFYTINDALAQRIISDSMQQDTSLSQHAADYSIYYLGEFDDSNGIITPLAEPKFMFNLAAFKPKQEITQKSFEELAHDHDHDQELAHV
jgi:hypothetical protein